MTVSAWSAYVQAATDNDPVGDPAGSSLWTGWVSVTVTAGPETEWWVAGVSWQPARLSALS